MTDDKRNPSHWPDVRLDDLAEMARMANASITNLTHQVDETAFEIKGIKEDVDNLGRLQREYREECKQGNDALGQRMSDLGQTVSSLVQAQATRLATTKFLAKIGGALVAFLGTAAAVAVVIIQLSGSS